MEVLIIYHENFKRNNVKSLLQVLNMLLREFPFFPYNPRFARRLLRDQVQCQKTDTKAQFKDVSDAVTRLLPFHLCKDDTATDKELQIGEFHPLIDHFILSLSVKAEACKSGFILSCDK